MTDNELIARWTGTAINRDEYEGQKEVMLVISPGRIARCVSTTVESGLSPSSDPWSPSTDITLWHGDDGLLRQIVMRCMGDEFADAFMDESDPPLHGAGEIWNLWGGLQATPTQLTAALVKTIKEGQ